MPRQISESSPRVKCPECGDEMSDKSLKRHLDDHKNVRYPCEYCAKTFSQKTNRDSHHRIHNDEWLQCDACGETCMQDAEMTRHKQEEHGHPRRGEKAPDNKRVTHSVIVLPTNGGPAASQKIRSNKESRRSKPYTIRRKHSSRLSGTPTSSSSSQVSSNRHSTSSHDVSSSVALSTPTPSSFSSYQNAIFDIARPPSPLIALPQASWDSLLGDAHHPEYSNWPTDPSGLDSLFCSSQIPRPENPHQEPHGLSEYLASHPDVFYPEHTLPSNIEQPVLPGGASCTSPFSGEAPLPAGVNYFQCDAYKLEDGYSIGNYVSPNQSDASPASEFWESLSPAAQPELIWRHPQCLDPSSLAPAPAFPNDWQTPSFEGSWEWDPLWQWMGVPFEETAFISFPESDQQNVNGLVFL